MSNREEQNLLVIIAHPDDESLGAGGTIRRHVEQGVSVDILSLTGNETRNKELQAACAGLGVRNLYLSERDDFAVDMSLIHEVIGAILKTRPIAIITHSQQDYNRNHTSCAQMVEQAVEWASHVTLFDNAHRVERIYNMEINTLLAKPNVFVDITDQYKFALAALKKHKSQVSKVDNFYLKLYDARTKLRGVQAACKRAEAFSITLPEHAGPFYPENNVESLV